MISISQECVRTCTQARTHICESKLLGLYVSLFQILSNCFSKVAVLFTFPRPHQHLLSVLLIVAVLVGMKLSLRVVLIFILMMDNYVKHFFFRVLIGYLCISFAELSVQIFCHFKLDYLSFYF